MTFTHAVYFLTGVLMGYSLCMFIREWLLSVPSSPISRNELNELTLRNKYIHKLRVAIKLELDKIRPCSTI